MSLNANQALREIHKVNEQTKEFERQQNAAREAMVKLVAEGKKGSKEWQNLKKSVKEYIKITSKEPSLFYPIRGNYQHCFLFRIIYVPLQPNL